MAAEVKTWRPRIYASPKGARSWGYGAFEVLHTRPTLGVGGEISRPEKELRNTAGPPYTAPVAPKLCEAPQATQTRQRRRNYGAEPVRPRMGKARTPVLLLARSAFGRLR